MSSTTIRRAINKKLAAMKYYSKVAVEFPAEKKIVYMTEAEIRVLQQMAADKFKYGGQEDFDTFVSQFIIYNGPTKRGSKPMTLRTDGIFLQEFKPGFFDVTTLLALELLGFND